MPGHCRRLALGFILVALTAALGGATVTGFEGTTACVGQSTFPSPGYNEASCNFTCMGEKPFQGIEVAAMSTWLTFTGARVDCTNLDLEETRRVATCFGVISCTASGYNPWFEKAAGHCFAAASSLFSLSAPFMVFVLCYNTVTEEAAGAPAHKPPVSLDPALGLPFHGLQIGSTYCLAASCLTIVPASAALVLGPGFAEGWVCDFRVCTFVPPRCTAGRDSIECGI